MAIPSISSIMTANVLSPPQNVAHVGDVRHEMQPPMASSSTRRREKYSGELFHSCVPACRCRLAWLLSGRCRGAGRSRVVNCVRCLFGPCSRCVSAALSSEAQFARPRAAAPLPGTATQMLSAVSGAPLCARGAPLGRPSRCPSSSCPAPTTRADASPADRRPKPAKKAGKPSAASKNSASPLVSSLLCLGVTFGDCWTA